MESKTYISVVLPVHNEEGNLNELHERLTKTLKKMGRTYEIIYVENGSSDDTVRVLKKLRGAKVIVLRWSPIMTKTGQTAALDAGIKAAKGELIVTMDSDLQNPPEEIPNLIKKMNEDDLDVVSGWRQKRRDSIFIKYLSKFGSWMRTQVLNPGVHDLGCTLKVYKREVFEGLDMYGEMHRYLVAILRWRGFSVGEIVVKHEPRKSGTSSYNWSKMFRGFVDMWQVWFWKKYSDRPLHLFGVGGVFLMVAGSGLLFFLGVLRLLKLISLSGSIWPLMAAFIFFTGLQLFVFGIILDMMIRTHYANGKEKSYLIKEKFEV